MKQADQDNHFGTPHLFVKVPQTGNSKRIFGFFQTLSFYLSNN